MFVCVLLVCLCVIDVCVCVFYIYMRARVHVRVLVCAYVCVCCDVWQCSLQNTKPWHLVHTTPGPARGPCAGTHGSVHVSVHVSVHMCVCMCVFPSLEQRGMNSRTTKAFILFPFTCDYSEYTSVYSNASKEGVSHDVYF